MTFLDFLLAGVVALWRNHPWLMAEAHVAGLLFTWMVGSTVYGKTGPGLIWGWLIAGMLLFLTITSQGWYLLIKYRSTPQIGDPWEAEFLQSGVHVKTRDREDFIAWWAFQNFRENRRAFIVYFNPGLYHHYPKRSLSPDAERNLRQLLNANVVPA